MEELTLITEEKEYVPETTKPGWPKTEEEWKRVEEERIFWEKAEKIAEGNPGNPEPGEPQGSNFHSLMLHAVAEMYGPGGIVVDEAKAKATSCECVEYKPGKYWCTSKGVIGVLTDGQERIFCNPREIVDRPDMKEKLTKWVDAVGICRAQLPPTDGRTRLEVYLDCMSRELKKAGVED